MITAEEIKAKYWALEVLSSHNQEDINNISGSLETSKIDLNPHQINAAMFALCNFMELIGFESEEDNIDMTNYERIKKMNVPEMARLLGSIHNDVNEHSRTINGDNVFDSFDDIEEWLESDVKDNDH